jgi:hypothetical protein
VDSYVERRHCDICGRSTSQLVKERRAGDDRVISSIAECTEHRRYPSGKVKFLQPDGEWGDEPAA